MDIYQPNMGMAVGYCQKGEWLKYTVNVAEDGEYEISANVAGENGTGSFVLYMDDVQIGSEIANAGNGFNCYTEVSGGKATLKAGEHELKLEITNDWIDIDYVEFKKTGAENPSAIRNNLRLATVEMNEYTVFDMSGKAIAKLEARGMDSAVEAVRTDMHAKGVYYVRSNRGALEIQKVTIR